MNIKTRHYSLSRLFSYPKSCDTVIQTFSDVPLRKIIHIDMDAFFASVEQRDNPELQGLPIAVGFDGTRGVVSTASYEARKYGVRSAMPIATAKRLCPNLRVVNCRHDRYKEVSNMVHDIFHEYTDQIEPLSIDEAFLDVTDNKLGMTLARDIAKDIKEKIRQRTGLTASAGVSYNKLLAKIASDYRKPDGLYVIHPDKALDFVAELPVETFWGVGPKTAEKMHHLGIFTGLQLREQSLWKLKKEFGKAGQLFYDFSRGIDHRPVTSIHIRKSVGCENTFLQDIASEQPLLEELDTVASTLERRITASKFEGYTLTLKIKFGDFTQITRSMTQNLPLQKKDIIMPLALQLLKQVDYNAEHPIRLIGLSVSNSHLPTTNLTHNPYEELWLDLDWDSINDTVLQPNP